MRRIGYFLTALAAVAVMAAGCERDVISLVDPTGSGSEGGSDDISETNFSTAVSVVFSNSGSATVSGADDDFAVTVSGNDVTIVYTGDTVVMYTLSGATSDGFFKLYSSRKQGITLSNVSITNKNGAAVNVQGTPAEPARGKRTFVVLEGSSTLADGPSYTGTPSTEDEKAAFFSEGQLIFSGSGSLTVNATGKAGITSDDYLHFTDGPAITVTSTAGHGLRANDYIVIDGGSLDVTASANMKKGISTDGYVEINGGTTTVKVTGGAAYDSEDQEYTGTAGVKADSYFRISGGTLTVTNSGTGGKGISSDGAGYFAGGVVNVTVTGSNYGSSGGGGGWGPGGGGGGSSANSVSAKGIKCDGNIVFSGSAVNVSAASHEGIESKGTVTISDGIVYSYSASDDAINSAGNFTISGGYVCGHSAGNDGLDANGNCYIQGGVVYAIGSSSPEVAVDANTEGGYKLYVQGGTLVAIGGLESGASLTQSCYSTSSWNKSTWYGLTVGSATYAFRTPSSGGTPLVVSGASTPSLKSGVTVGGGNTLFNGTFTTDASFSGGSAVSLTSYTGGNGGGGGGGGGPWGH